MKQLIILAFLAISMTCTGCATTAPGTSTTTVQQAQQVAEKSLYAAGSVLKATPPVLNALYDAGKISKADYNNAVVIYNRALASFNVAVDVLKGCVAAGQDPGGSTVYLAALTTFATDSSTVNNVITALGGVK